MLDPYTLLQLPRNCTQEDIKKAFYKLAHIHHPDKGGDEAKFKEINAAYQWLKENHRAQQGMKVVRNPDGSSTVYYTIIF